MTHAAGTGGLAVSARGMEKRFGAVRALRGVDLEVASGRTAMLAESLIEYNADREYRRVSATEITESTALVQAVLDQCRWARTSDVDAVRLKSVMRKLAKVR